jgi:hypothetical protein
MIPFEAPVLLTNGVIETDVFLSALNVNDDGIFGGL